MKAHKREREHRAFDHGYRAGVRGRSTEQCPYISVIDLRASWLRGWREGRDELISGTVHAQNG
jgi:ribosome modulation factor